MSSGDLKGTTLTLSTLILAYRRLQSALVIRIRSLATNMSSASPGEFLLLQFQMSTVSQIGQSISNLIAQVNSVINNSVRNQRSQ
jgi:hypothetical protein